MSCAVVIRLVAVDRFCRLLERFPVVKTRFFTTDEQAYCERFKKGPEERYAARFAAKCAYRSCHPSTPWLAMEVVNDALGAPNLLVRDVEAVRSISLTHEGGWAAASLLIDGAIA